MNARAVISAFSNRDLLVAHRLLVRENSAQKWAARDAIIQQIRIEAFDRALGML